jgi:hypothetical protein
MPRRYRSKRRKISIFQAGSGQLGQEHYSTTIDVPTSEKNGSLVSEDDFLWSNPLEAEGHFFTSLFRMSSLRSLIRSTKYEWGFSSLV